MDPAVAGLKKKGLRIDSINVREHPEAAKQHSVRRLPTFIYYLDGKEVRRASGNMTATELLQMWRKPLFWPVPAP